MKDNDIIEKLHKIREDMYEEEKGKDVLQITEKHNRESKEILSRLGINLKTAGYLLEKVK